MELNKSAKFWKTVMLKDGRVQAVDHDMNPYTGDYEGNVGDTTKITGKYLNGLKDGKWRYQGTDGQYIIEHYSKGMINGEVYIYQKGQQYDTETRTNFVNGLNDGELCLNGILRDGNGGKQIFCPMIGGYRFGKLIYTKERFPNGNEIFHEYEKWKIVKAEDVICNYKLGKRQGKIILYYENGDKEEAYIAQGLLTYFSKRTSADGVVTFEFEDQIMSLENFNNYNLNTSLNMIMNLEEFDTKELCFYNGLNRMKKMLGDLYKSVSSDLSSTKLRTLFNRTLIKKLEECVDETLSKGYHGNYGNKYGLAEYHSDGQPIKENPSYYFVVNKFRETFLQHVKKLYEKLDKNIDEIEDEESFSKYYNEVIKSAIRTYAEIFDPDQKYKFTKTLRFNGGEVFKKDYCKSLFEKSVKKGEISLDVILKFDYLTNLFSERFNWYAGLLYFSLKYDIAKFLNNFLKSQSSFHTVIKNYVDAEKDVSGYIDVAKIFNVKEFKKPKLFMDFVDVLYLVRDPEFNVQNYNLKEAKKIKQMLEILRREAEDVESVFYRSFNGNLDGIIKMIEELNGYISQLQNGNGEKKPGEINEILNMLAQFKMENIDEKEPEKAYQSLSNLYNVISGLKGLEDHKFNKEQQKKLTVLNSIDEWLHLLKQQLDKKFHELQEHMPQKDSKKTRIFMMIFGTIVYTYLACKNFGFIIGFLAFISSPIICHFFFKDEDKKVAEEIKEFNNKHGLVKKSLVKIDDINEIIKPFVDITENK